MKTRSAVLGTVGTTLLAALVLAGCGGGGSSGGTVAGSSSSGGGSTGGTTGGTTGGSTGTTYVAGQYLAASQYSAKCASPRSGTDPITNVAYPYVQGAAHRSVRSGYCVNSVRPSR